MKKKQKIGKTGVEKLKNKLNPLWFCDIIIGIIKKLCDFEDEQRGNVYEIIGNFAEWKTVSFL